MSIPRELLGYYVPPDVAARKPPEYWKPLPAPKPRGSSPAPSAARVTTFRERPEPQPHNLDAPGVREPLTGVCADVFKVMCDGAFFTPECCWSETLIAEKAGVSRRTVAWAKRQLRAQGWITWVRVWRPGQRWQNCVYTIHAGWHRPHRKSVLEWLDKRRSRVLCTLNELPRPLVEKETQRSKARRVRNGFSRPWEGWLRKQSPPVRQVRTVMKVSEEEIRRAGGRERAEGFATWVPLALTGRAA